MVFYSLLIRFYILIAYFFSLFDKKAALFVNGRKNWKDQLSKKIPKNAQLIWFHCSSVGEFEQARTLIEKIKLLHPNKFILLTFYSPSGFELRKNYQYADLVMYMPFDLKKNAAYFLEICNPEKIFFIKYEFWWNFLIEIQKRSIDHYLVSAAFRKDQWIFKHFTGITYPILKNYTHIFVQNDDILELLKLKGIKNCSVANDTRFDRVFSIAKNVKKINFPVDLSQYKLVVVCGSTWKKDDLSVKYSIEKINDSKIFWIIVPHEVDDDNISEALKIYNCKNENLFTNFHSNKNIMIVNTIGYLSSLYSLADIAYVGGGFGKGIHNTLEPAAFGVPVIFGPNFQKFYEAKDLIQIEGGFTISNEQQLYQQLIEIINNEPNRLSAGKKSKDYISQHIGGTDYIYSLIF